MKAYLVQLGSHSAHVALTFHPRNLIVSNDPIVETLYCRVEERQTGGKSCCSKKKKRLAGVLNFIMRRESLCKMSSRSHVVPRRVKSGLSA